MTYFNRHRPVLFAILQTLLLTGLPAVSPLFQTEPQLLEPGKPVERDLAGIQTHSYRISLSQGLYVRVAVEQRGIDVVVSFLAPDGTKLNEMDTPNGSTGPELLSTIADKPGLYRLDISSLDKNAPAGRYQVKIEDLRKATPVDQSRIVAEKNFAEAVQLHYVDRRVASIRKALEKYESTLEAWRGAEERRMEVMTLFQISLAHTKLNEDQKAVEYLLQTLRPIRTMGDRPIEANLLRQIGKKYKEMGEREKSVEFHERALALWRELGDRNNEALQLCDTGHLYFWWGNPRKALEYLTLALPLSRSVGSRLIESATLMNLGLTHWALDEYEKALDYYEKAMPLYRAMGDRQGEAETLTNIGLAYSGLSEYQKSLEAYNRALELWRAIGHRRGEARTLIDTGEIYRTLRQYELALKQFNQVLNWGNNVDAGWRSTALGEIGWIHVSRGETRQAIEYFEQVLRLTDSSARGMSRHKALYGLGYVHSSLGENEKALDYFNQLLSLRQMTSRPFETEAHSSIARLHDRMRNTQKAMEHYKIALDLWRERRNRIGEANALISIAYLEREQGNLDEARTKAAAALKLDEEVRVTRANEEARTTFHSQAVSSHYEFYIDLLMQLHKASPSAGHDRSALETSERTRARGLLDLLAEDRDQIRQGADPALLERERDLRQRLLAKAALQERSGATSPQQSAALGSEIENLLAQYRDLEATIRTKSPRYAALTQPQPVASHEIQKLLYQDTLLLEYFLGEQRSFVWAVTATSLSAHELPKRAAIEIVARRMYDAVTARNKRSPAETASAERERIARSRVEYRESANELSRMLLGPVAAQLGNRRLLIVADGALQYIPLAALPSPLVSGQWPVVSGQQSKGPARIAKSDRQKPGNRDWSLTTDHRPLPGGEQSTGPARIAKSDGQKPGNKDWSPTTGQQPLLDQRTLIADHEIISVPSASILSVLRREVESRRPASKTVAVIADPVFTSDDARLSAGKRTEQPRLVADRGNEEYLQKSLRDTGLTEAGSSLPRLVNTRREAKVILALAQAGSRKQALDFDASRATASNPDLGQYKIVHFATHGLLNDVHPELSGLVLSLVDESGRPQDGFLRLIDVYNLSLPVELVVLSACRTGLGKEIRGEGLVGLTRGFMHAGAARVTASLWKVDDRATAELMKRFYEGMLQERLSPAAALRAAQVGMWKQRQWQDPYYWGAFVLYGEWR